MPLLLTLDRRRFYKSMTKFPFISQISISCDALFVVMHTAMARSFDPNY